MVPKYVDCESSPFSTDLEEDCVPEQFESISTSTPQFEAIATSTPLHELTSAELLSSGFVPDQGWQKTFLSSLTVFNQNCLTELNQ